MPVSYTHLDVYKRQALGSIAEEGTAVLEIASPELWNTENPYLYKLCLLYTSKLYRQLLLRTVAMENQIPYVTASLNDSEMVFKDQMCIRDRGIVIRI